MDRVHELAVLRFRRVDLADGAWLDEGLRSNAFDEITIHAGPERAVAIPGKRRRSQGAQTVLQCPQFLVPLASA